MIHKDRLRRHRMESPVFAERHFADVVVIADAAEYDVGTASGIGWCIGTATFVLSKPSRHLVRIAVVDDDLMIARRQVSCHRKPHDAQADECRFHEAALRGSSPIERAIISRMISDDPA